MKLQSPQHWKDYELIDSGNFEKLERFGFMVLRRPEPQAVWSPHLPEKEWQKRAKVTFGQESSSAGIWTKSDPSLPDQWMVQYANKGLKLKFRLGLTRFKHVGLFPEQAVNWEFIYNECKQLKDPRVLNLFAYTGGSTLAAKAGGADVIHCDSIKQVISWAKENMEASGLTNVRWLVEDAFRFVKRESSRKKIYQGIILDPPAWGHGPKGEKWKLEDMIDEMMTHVAAILDPENGFLVFNAYSLGYSALILQNLVRTHFGKDVAERAEIGELFLEDSGGRKLPAGVFVRFGKGY